jgi:hypothetical protein
MTNSPAPFPCPGARISRPKAKGLSISGLSALLAAAPLAFADPAIEEHHTCPVSAAQAHSLADRLYEQGSYQLAGECYLAARDYDRANHAFVKAVGPASTATARQLTELGEQAKTMLRNVQSAFTSHH